MPLLPVLLLAGTALANCPLFEVIPTEKDVETSFYLFTDEGTTSLRRLPRGSFVWKVPVQQCNGERLTVQLLSVDPLYWDERQGDPPAPLTFGCIDAKALAPVANTDAVLSEGMNVKLAAASSCVDPSGTVPYGWMDGVVPRRASTAQDAVKATWERLFGPIPAVPRVTDWGFVALPFAHTLTVEEMAERDKKERLGNQAQTGRGVFQLGPGDTPVYIHYLGDDDPNSDIWGSPQLVSRLIEVSKGWYDFCVATAAPAAKIKPETAKRACTVQFGDLAWYNDRDPDPLGHHSHRTGRCVDVRPFRTDGSWYEANWRRRDDRKGFGHRYSRELTQAFLTWATANYTWDQILFNDPKIRKKLPQVDKYANHDDHMHMCIPRSK